ncbi:hypothetical protein ACH4ZU_36610 [Streptomyces sp. NPDC020472]|uniref:hypothetical protein n=1 Tax=Streptomyces sp. NPDC020472 TaxID=3365075 RepID=UPI0037BA06CA
MLTPLEGVGPLRFGMSADEVRAALPEAVELSRFSAEPFSPEIYGLQLGFHPAVPAVYAYFEGTGRLFCVAADAVHGPRVTLDGLELTGRMPALLQKRVLDLHSSGTHHVSYGPRGNPGLNGIGMVLRSWTDHLRARPTH